ncbi:MAG: penicillin-binding transpeptidase domain-containing protein, partial [Verrucomicrobiales bacterium]
ARIEKELRATLDGLSVPVKSLDGLIIETSVDLDLQLEAAKLIDRHIKDLQGGKEGGQKDPTMSDDLEGAFVMIDNGSGRIVASVGSRDFFRSEYDRATEMTRPPGSAFLPFIYATAFETGAFTPESLVFDAPFDNREMGVGSIGGILGEWSTENPENRWEGHITASNALRYSKNSPTARLGLQVGLDPVRRLIRAAGIKSEVKEEPGSVLGGSEVTLTELTHAYTVFSNSGTPSPEPALIREIHDAFGKPIPSPSSQQPQRAMSAKTADSVAACLALDVAGGIIKGKSGTTSSFTDVWYFGFNGEYTWGTWLGRDSYKPIKTLAYGSELARPLAEKIMARKKSDDAAVPVAASEKQ